MRQERPARLHPLGHLERNRDMLAHYATPRWRGEPISTGFVENGVNEILAKRMNWMQQTRKARPLHPYLRAQLPDRLIASTQHNFVTQDPLTVDPLDHASISAVELACDMSVELLVALPVDLDAAMERLYAELILALLDSPLAPASGANIPLFSNA